MNMLPRDHWFGEDHLWEQLFSPQFAMRDDGFFQPRVDIIDKEDSYLFVAELPGVAKEDIDVQLHDGVLSIQAKIEQKHQQQGDNVLRKERRSGFFRRNINVGKAIQAEDISAELVNGLLMLKAPKAVAKVSEKQQIEIS
ncbi:Hsp20/alpha crystallin family protein [Agarivorans litoreus]|uniref:Hsp20/alpha crystallin family protein n=1 Tax=Agarivorans litoreus TaxID=1510455 RepID=UPI001C7DA4E9|nr:Hsp20/alpha crystallin family protein [Agarivorans litoreus]